jgi:hypothetical protein
MYFFWISYLDFIIKIEQVSNPWTTNPSNERSIKDQKNV